MTGNEIGDNMRRIVKGCLAAAVEHSGEFGCTSSSLYALCQEFCEESEYLAIMRELVDARKAVARYEGGTVIFGRRAHGA